MNQSIINANELTEWANLMKKYYNNNVRSVYARKNDNVTLWYYNKTGQFVIIENCKEAYSTYNAEAAVETYNMI